MTAQSQFTTIGKKREPKPLYVAQPMLPKLADFQALLSEMWDTKILTNEGPFHRKLEDELAKYIGVPTTLLFNNATIALLIALRLFDPPPEAKSSPHL